MRQGQQNHHNNNKRMRGRNNRKGPNPLTRSYESNGGDVKIRGTALHIAEKYVQLARDAQSSGDRVASENYLQHAEHYYRVVAAAQAQMPQPQPVFRSDADGDDEEDRFEAGSGLGGNPGNQGYQGGEQPAFGAPDPQPYVNGNGNLQGEDDGPRQGNQQGDYPQQNRQDNRGEFRGQEYRGQDSNRGDQPYGGGQQQHRERGDFRGRRRRPFRERYQDQGGPRNEASAGESGPPPSEGPSGEE
jgi:hypothetical protein